MGINRTHRKVFTLDRLPPSVYKKWEAAFDVLKKFKVPEVGDRIGEITFSTAHSIRAVLSEISYRSEVKDYWQSPGETLALGTGDCEDFAILFSHLMSDRPTAFIMFTLGYNRDTMEPHAWVIFAMDNRFYVASNGQYYLMEEFNSRYQAMATLYPDEVSVHRPSFLKFVKYQNK